MKVKREGGRERDKMRADGGDRREPKRRDC